jgi:hypothetical protein
MLAPCCVKPSVVVLVPLLALVGVSPSYAPTALRAAIGAMYSDPKKPVVVVRVNVVGSYATVLTSGGRIEGGLVASPILVEHFTFGWQPLALWESRCDLEELVLRKSVEEQLMRGMPALRDDRPCHTSFLKDAGPRPEVEAVRKLMPGPLVPYVVVYGSWAMGEWYGAGGGDSLYHKREGRWQLVESGGGAMGVDYMHKYGVPQAAWCKFGIFDAKCR